jgi:hypothetical protein
MAETRKFSFKYGSLRWLLKGIGMGPRHSYIEVSDDEVHVVMGWAFRARIPRSAVASVGPIEGRVVSIGVHGWGGVWLVNGAGTDIVSVKLKSVQHAVMTGVTVKLRELQVGVDDPEGLMKALAPS